MNDGLKPVSPAQIAARIAFACGITALVAISAYLGILRLLERTDTQREQLDTRQ